MIRQSVRGNVPLPYAILAAATLLSVPIHAAEPPKAEVVDIRAQALASRDQLAAEIAQTSSARLRNSLVSAACDAKNNCELAHWYSQEVKIEGAWKSLGEAQQQAAGNQALVDYYRLRDQASDTLKVHQKLAKWCRKHKLPELERLHWLHVLRFQANHPAALNVLDLVWHKGSLLSKDEFDARTEQERRLAREKRKWKTIARRLRRAMEQGEPEQQAAAKHEIREIRDPLAVGPLVEEFQLEPDDQSQAAALQTELMASLGNIVAPEAVVTLVENVVFSPPKIGAIRGGRPITGETIFRVSATPASRDGDADPRCGLGQRIRQPVGRQLCVHSRRRHRPGARTILQKLQPDSRSAIYCYAAVRQSQDAR